MLRATSLCSSSEHCIADISEKLRRWGVGREDADDIIAFLVSGKYIDERRYALAYANDKLRFSHWGKVKIRTMLQSQHISSADITFALDSLDPDECSGCLRDAFGTKLRSLGLEGKVLSYEEKGKIIRFLLQRGFEMDGIMRLIDSLPSE